MLKREHVFNSALCVMLFLSGHNSYIHLHSKVRCSAGTMITYVGLLAQDSTAFMLSGMLIRSKLKLDV